MSKASEKRWAQVLVQAALLFASACFIWQSWAGAATPPSVSYSEFIENIRWGRVEAVQISATEPLGKPRRESQAEQPGGVGASRVRDLFEQAKQHAPCIVFIDELDWDELNISALSAPQR